MFFDDSLKELKKELKTLGADMSYVRQWQKTFDKVKKQSDLLQEQYVRVKHNLENVYVTLKQLEQFLISCKESADKTNIKNQVQSYAKEMKKYQNAFNHEFLISKEDADFQSTYASILCLSNKDLKQQKDVLILQSEVENLLALTKEALEKQWPSFRAMAYFYLNHVDKEIFDLPHADKIEKVSNVYKEEFIEPMYKELSKYMDAERAQKILEVDVWN